jgi:TPR repeat protein
MRRLAPIALALTFIAFTAPAMAAKNGKLLEMSSILPRAQAGDPAAEVAVGKMYESGKGIARDYAQAETWYAKAADQGSLDGALALGELYFKGHGVGRDFTEAEKYIEGPAEQGIAEAQYYMGWFYSHGQGVRFQDFNKAAEWMLRAANQNNARAQMEMGDFAFNGQGMGQNYEDAYFWYLLAGNHKLDKHDQKILQKQLDRTRPTLSATQLDSAQNRARDWKPVMESKGAAARK